MKCASIHTLGCRLNQADTALIADALRQTGYELKPFGEVVDLVVVNSCLVTAAAGQKTRQAVRSARRSNPEAFIILAGCSAEIEAEAWEAENAVDLVVPNRLKTGLAKMLSGNLNRIDKPIFARKGNTALAGADEEALFTEAGCGYYPEHTRANLKIQEGCNFFCTYCIVPYARGKPRSRQWHDVLREARELIGRGHKEIVLTGVNIACYNDGGRTLADLVRELAGLDGDFRLRLSSTEPGKELTQVVEVMRETDRVCRFLHVPMQYGADKILQAMNRRYTVAEYRAFLEQAADAVEGICLGSDIIVGFPGETAAHFKSCLQNLESLPLAYLHVFRYSARPGTPAADFKGRVHGDLVDTRRHEIIKLAAAKTADFCGSMKGQAVTVLTEKVNKKGHWEGLTDNYLRAELEDGSDAGISTNQFIPAKVIEHMQGRRIVCRTIA